MLSWLETEVLPGSLIDEEQSKGPKLAIVNSGAVRFDIFKGAFTKDTTLIVCPFTNKFVHIKDVPYSAAKQVLPLINAGGPVFQAEGLQSWSLAPAEQMSIKGDFIANEHDHRHDQKFQAPLGSKATPELVPGYTTKDDAGDDGDDTLHSPISFYRVPNCIEAKLTFPEQGDPETVDLVFIDFVQPWILLALKFAGKSYSAIDVKPYLGNQTFTGLIESWVADNWEKKC
jgi:hypothetical protein